MSQIEKADCLGCQGEFDYDPQMCCSGHDCGCMGRPTNPQVCSSECMDKVYPSTHMQDLLKAPK